MARFLGDDFQLPNLDPWNTPFYTAGSLQMQFCRNCGSAQHPPDDVCYSCQSTALEFRAVPGTGTIESFVVIHHPIHPMLKDKVPFAVALVSVDGADGCNVMGNVLGAEPKSLAIGQRVRVVFEEVTNQATGDELKIPQWELAGELVYQENV